MMKLHDVWRTHAKHPNLRWFLTGLFVGGFLVILNESLSACKGPLDSCSNIKSPIDSPAADNISSIRVFCWVMTSPSHHVTHAVHVKNTWGQRCTKLLFISSQNDPTLPSVDIKASEGRQTLTNKTFSALHYIYKHHASDADWFLKADDDTYVIMENLRHFLSGQDPEKVIYFGQRFELNWGGSVYKYCSGGAGYVLSRRALRVFARQAPDSRACHSTWGVEDQELGHCLEDIGVALGDTRDPEGRSRFHAVPPWRLIMRGSLPDWYGHYTSDHTNGMASINRYAISFHYMRPDMMYNMECALYHLQLYST